jgi:hypothetical protein
MEANEADEYPCEACGKVKPHCIRRINRDGAPRWCDECHRK